MPIGNFGMNLYEVLINELYFQGVSVMNQLRKIYFIDLIDPKIHTIETKDFNSVLFVYSEDEKQDKERQDIADILQLICEKKNKYDPKYDNKYDDLSLREFMVKIFLTIARNSNEKINSSILDNIIKKFMTEKNSEVNRDNNNYNDDNIEIEDDNDRSKISEKDINLINSPGKDKPLEDNTRSCMDTLLKIIDVGLDKNYEDFMQDIQMIAQPLVKISPIFGMMGTKGVKDNPITDFRCYLKPKYNEKKKIGLPIFDNGDIVVSDHPGLFNLYESCKNSLRDVYKKYFNHLEDKESDKEEKIHENKEKRINFFKDFKTKIALVEDKKVMSSFIHQIYQTHKKLDDITENEHMEDKYYFWPKFTNNNKEIDMNYVLYLLPHYESYKDMFPMPSKNEKNYYEDFIPLLSEFISNHDHIYQSLVFNPWSAQRESDLAVYMEKITDIDKYKSDFKSP